MDEDLITAAPNLLRVGQAPIDWRNSTTLATNYHIPELEPMEPMEMEQEGAGVEWGQEMELYFLALMELDTWLQDARARVRDLEQRRAILVYTSQQHTLR